MRYFGFADAVETPIGRDGGVDVWSSEALGQVKMQGGLTKIEEVQRHYGVAQADNKIGIFFSLAGYTTDALAFGNRVKMALFTYDYQGQPSAVNEAAQNFFN